MSRRAVRRSFVVQEYKSVLVDALAYRTDPPLVY